MRQRRLSFDNLAGAYVWLERLAFGSDLETARFCLLDHLRGCRRILVLGEGDGRFLAKLVKKFPAASVDCLEMSEAMIAKAKSRLTVNECVRVAFRRENVLGADFTPDTYDAVVTLFFLDCFATEDVARLIARVKTALHKEACWLWADFTLPPCGWRRWRATFWVGGLYFFFRWQTGLAVCHLPPTESLLSSAGFSLRWGKTMQAGLLRSAVYARPRDIKINY